MRRHWELFCVYNATSRAEILSNAYGHALIIEKILEEGSFLPKLIFQNLLYGP